VDKRGRGEPLTEALATLEQVSSNLTEHRLACTAVTEIQGVLETALYARDLDAAADFYTRVLGLEIESKVEGRHVFLRCGHAMLLVFDPEATAHAHGPVPAHGATGPGHIAFAVPDEDMDAWPARLGALGVEIESDVVWPGGGRSLYFRDPAGNSVELATPRIWGFT
jgi:catechol 2,3-dioxygenase-like lactoylglutathione lyase family enzyme